MSYQLLLHFFLLIHCNYYYQLRRRNWLKIVKIDMEGARRYFVGGNWKCNGALEFNKFLIEDVINKLEFDPAKVDVIVAPTTLHIAMAKVMVADNVKVASQNVSLYGTGAYTGEIAAEQLTDFGIEWVIVGHSERRALYGEANETVGTKVSNALEAGLNVILCIGETLEQRESNSTNDVLKEQLDACKESVKDWSKVVIAYEPVWAIGTGKVATPEQAQETHAYIRQWMAENVSEEVGAATRIIYGGSVNDKNCGDLINQSEIDGFLVGGASLKLAFQKIVSTASEHQGTQESA